MSEEKIISSVYIPDYIVDSDGQTIGTLKDDLGIKEGFKELEIPTLSGKQKKFFAKLMQKGLGIDIGDKKIYVINQAIDPDLSPSNYTREKGSNYEYEYIGIITTCKGICNIQPPIKTSKDYTEYNNIHQIPPVELREIFGNEDDFNESDINDEIDNESLIFSVYIDEMLKKLEQEYIKKDIPPQRKQPNNPSQKLIDVFCNFQKENCRDKFCKSCHFLIAQGRYQIGTKILDGIILVKFPDWLQEEKEQINDLRPIKNPDSIIKQVQKGIPTIYLREKAKKDLINILKKIKNV